MRPDRGPPLSRENYAMTDRLRKVLVLLCCVAGFLSCQSLTFAGELASLDPRDWDDAKELAKRIDHHLNAGMEDKNVKPVPLADDGEFFRRINLDLSGCIPEGYRVQDFYDMRYPEKRLRWAETLLQDTEKKDRPNASPGAPGYAEHFANVWRSTLLPRTTNEFGQNFAPAFEIWLRSRLQANTGYDKMVREILTAPYTAQANPNALSFFYANEQKPTNLAAATSRLFLGVNIECARCHPHPFAKKWKRENFWELSAFFVNNGAVRAKIQIENTDKMVEPRFLDGTEPKWKPGDRPTAVLADWITSDDNPYFARATANRVWAYFFGIGLIEPVDEPGDENPPSHPELLDELAKAFIAHKYDLKFLIRAIVASDAYQRTSAAPDGKATDPRLFARMPLRGLSPEQLLDSLLVATGHNEPGMDPYQRQFFGQPNQSLRAAFLSRFTLQDSRTETQTSILQALHMMNSKLVEKALDSAASKTGPLSNVARSYADNKDRAIASLYRMVLARKPRPEEVERVIKFVDARPADEREKALRDVMWALLNSAEFMLNH
jgi:hypothetical protein